MRQELQIKTKLGMWSVGLNAFFLLAIIASVALVKLFKILAFQDRWWDVTVGVAFPASLVALALGSFAVGKSKEHSVWVYLSIFISICTVFFLLLHSLFIND